MKFALSALVLLLYGCSEKSEPLVNQSQIVGDEILSSLTAMVGDEENGRRIFVDREKGHCILCHQIAGESAEFQGNLGPTLTNVGDRLTVGQLRLRIVDYQIVKPGTTMPSYYRRHDLYDVGSDYEGEPMLSAQDVEDLVAFLASRKE